MADPGARILLADCDRRMLSAAGDMLYGYGYDVTGILDSGRAVLDAVRETEPDIVVLGMILRDEDGFEVLNRIAEMSLSAMPAVAMLLPQDQKRLWQQASEAGAFAAISLPPREEDVLEAVRLASPMDRLRPRYAKAERIREILDRLSVDSTHKGYRYLSTAIGVASRSRSLYRAMTTVVYPETARQHGATAKQVERCIRTAIDAAWVRGDLESQYIYFGNTIDGNRGKPTNSEFIARVTEALRLEAM